MKIVISIFTLIIISAGYFYFINRYWSAFEADQACHSIKWREYGESATYGCDHDLETRQWLLFKKGEMSEPAIVLKRFRY